MRVNKNKRNFFLFEITCHNFMRKTADYSYPQLWKYFIKKNKRKEENKIIRQFITSNFSIEIFSIVKDASIEALN